MSETIKQAFDTLKVALQEDNEYAWSWHCNVAMAFVDANRDSGITHTVIHRLANEGAAIFMQRCFDIDIRQSKQWKSLYKGNKFMASPIQDRRKGERRVRGRRCTDPLILSQRDYDGLLASLESDEEPSEKLWRLFDDAGDER